ncbi:MAG: ATP-binding cassette domain-containing protein [Chitinophagales bacterium]|nr:ATP-binding cassette domain-containing protein [Bacteroidota bacterium]
MNVLTLENIEKWYGDYKAVDNISLQVPPQTVFGLLGPNGAGKTSLIRIITNILEADSGRVLLNGNPSPKNRMMEIGYMPEERGLYKKMKVGEQLMYLARLKNLSTKEARQRIGEWYEKFDIASWDKKKIEELSKGMQQKIQFIATVLHRPKLIILDEPFSGLDPVNTNLIREEMENLRREGSAILFSTHRMEQVEQICEYIALINKGKKILEGKVADVRQQFKENIYSISLDNTTEDALESNDIFTIKQQRAKDWVLSLAENKTPNDILRYFIEKNVHIHAFHEILPTINEIFIAQVTDKV